MMLGHIGERSAALKIQNALYKVYRSGKSLTRDVGGTATTEEFTRAVVKAF